MVCLDDELLRLRGISLIRVVTANYREAARKVGISLEGLRFIGAEKKDLDDLQEFYYDTLTALQMLGDAHNNFADPTLNISRNDTLVGRRIIDLVSKGDDFLERVQKLEDIFIKYFSSGIYIFPPNILDRIRGISFNESHYQGQLEASLNN